MVSSKIIKSGINGVAVAQNGLIFGEDGAAGSRMVSRCLRGLRDTRFNAKMIPAVTPNREIGNPLGKIGK